MRAFRSHLHEFETRGDGRFPCSKPQPDVPIDTPGMEINDMMKTKFSRSWRHSLLAWFTFMTLLLLAYIYAENTQWDSWFHTPTTYNISALLEEGADDSMTLDSGKPSPLVNPVDGGDATHDEDGAKKAAKTPKVSKEDQGEHAEMPETKD